MSLNDRTAEVGRHLGRSYPPTPCKSWVSCSRLPQTVSGRVLGISKGGNSTTLPCATSSSTQLHSSWSSCRQQQPFEPDHSVGFQSTSLSTYPDPHIISLSVRILWETVSKPYCSQDKHHSLLSLLHQVTRLIVGGYQLVTHNLPFGNPCQLRSPGKLLKRYFFFSK